MTSQQAEDLPQVTTSSFPRQDVCVKNTFIQLKPSGDADSQILGTPSTRQRSTHKRCVSEPSWLEPTCSTPGEPMSLPKMVANAPWRVDCASASARMVVPEDCETPCDFSSDLSPSAAFFDSQTLCFDTQQGSRAAFEGSTTASSPQLTFRDDAAPEEDRGFRRGHLRQLSNQTADGFDMDVQGASLGDEGSPGLHGTHVRQWSTVTADSFEATSWSLPAAASTSFSKPFDGTAMQQEVLHGMPAVGVAPVSQSFATATSTSPPFAQEPPMFLSTSPIGCPKGGNCMPEVWASLSPEADIAAVADTAYARGVAAGVAQAAFARGYVTSTGNPDVDAAVAASMALQLQQGGMRRSVAGSASETVPPHVAQHPSYDTNGACRLGVDGRNSHDRIAAHVGSSGMHISLAHALGKPSEASPREYEKKKEASPRESWQMFWCDPRVFKEVEMKDHLKSELTVPVKCYRTADMCVRLLKKKQDAQMKPVSRLFLVSWTNALTLVPFLSEEPSLLSKVVILCDECASRGYTKAVSWAAQYPFVKVVATWSQAIDALKEGIP